MQSIGFQLSSDQAEAYDKVSQLLQGAGIDLDNDKLLPLVSEKSVVMALVGKAGSGKTLLLSKLYQALDDLGLELITGDYESRKRRVYMAGPDNLMLILHTVRAILRDARMHEKAGLIQTEVDRMMQDVSRLDERVRKLATHFRQTEKDIDDIQISTRRITSRGGKITQIDVDDDSASGDTPELPV